MNFGEKLTKETWDFIEKDDNSTKLVKQFEEYHGKLIDETFPKVSMRITENDKPWITKEMNEWRRRHQRIYRKQGKSKKYMELKNLFDEKRTLAMEKYKMRILQDAKEGKRTNAYKALRRMDPEYNKQREICLESHQEEGFPLNNQ